VSDILFLKFRQHREQSSPAHRTIQVFVGYNPDALGLAGDVVMRTEEWEQLDRWLDLDHYSPEFWMKFGRARR